MAGFKWSAKSNKVALALAEGKTRQEVAIETGVGERTIYRWLADIDFAAEVDRLTLMVDLSSRAERVRVAKRIIKKMQLPDGTLPTSKDALDWLKFLQSETDGIKLDFAALLQLEASVADEGQDRSSDSEAAPLIN